MGWRCSSAGAVQSAAVPERRSVFVDSLSLSDSLQSSSRQSLSILFLGCVVTNTPAAPERSRVALGTALQTACRPWVVQWHGLAACRSLCGVVLCWAGTVPFVVPHVFPSTSYWFSRATEQRLMRADLCTVDSVQASVPLVWLQSSLDSGQLAVSGFRLHVTSRAP